MREAGTWLPAGLASTMPLHLWMATAVLYIATYDHGTRYTREFGTAHAHSDKHTRLRLQSEPWFTRLCSANSVAFESSVAPGQRGAANLVVRALVRVQQDALYHNLTEHTEQFTLLWNYYNKPLDAAGVRVLDVCRYLDPRQLHLMRRHQHGGSSAGRGPAARIQIAKRGIVWPGHDMVSDAYVDCELGDARPRLAADILAAWGVTESDHVPVLCVPDPIGRLLVAGAWSDLLILGRWSRVFPDWPPQEWIDCRRERHRVIEDAELSIDYLSKLARRLRQWSKTLLARAEEDDDEGELAMTLEADVLHLDAVVEGMRRKEGKRFPLEFLVRCMLLSHRLKNSATLKEHIYKTIQIFPAPLQAAARDCLSEGSLKVPSPSTLGRFQLIFDVGWMMYKRSLYDSARKAGEKWVHYGFADSSTHGHRDWFIVRVISILESKLAVVMDAVRELVSLAAQVRPDEGSDDDYPELTEDMSARRIRCADVIHENMTSSISPPVALGIGHTKLQDKAAALLYTFFLECGWAHLVFFLNAFASFTTDMGVELGLNDFSNLDFNQLLPRYVPSSSLDKHTKHDNKQKEKIDQKEKIEKTKIKAIVR